MSDSKIGASGYDLIVLGAGPAGNGAASACRAAGMHVAIVESRALGGTCPLRGCNPKKILVSAAGAIARSADLRGRGVVHESRIDWHELIDYKNEYVEPVPEEIENSFYEQGIDIYFGKCKLNGKNTVKVGDDILTGDKILIATGAEPMQLGIQGEELLTSSDDFLELKQLPEDILFVGGGYISFEFAHVAARAGVKVTMIEAMDRVLGGFDRDIVEHLKKASEDAGIEIHVSMPVQSLKRDGSDLLVAAGSEGEREFRANLAVHGAGRVPAILDLNLEEAGVKYSKKGVAVNEYLQSVSNPAVYAVGDAAETEYMLTPTATKEAEAVARNLIEGKNVATPALEVVPSAVFTIPPLATVGATEEQLKGQGVEYDRVFKNTSTWFTSESVGLKHSAIKMLTERGTGKILGVHILGYHAEEMINVFGLAMRFGLAKADLKKMVWAYPTATYDIKHLV